MMILRFMSANEAIRLLRGEVLERGTNHKATGFNTTSYGHCFAIVKEHKPSGMYHTAKRLSGIVIMDVCLVGNLRKNPSHLFTKTHGQYKIDDRPQMIAELSAKEYCLDDFTDWKMYTPELPPPLQMFKVIASPNWLEPVLTAEGRNE